MRKRERSIPLQDDSDSVQDKVISTSFLIIEGRGPFVGAEERRKRGS